MVTGFVKTRQERSLVFWTVMLSAVVITLLRVLSPFEVGKDQALQLEAAWRWVSGLGLTSTYFASHQSDISQPPVPGYLTWWPPGFSVLSAALMWAGLPLSAFLKLIYAPTTLLGWAGWGRVAQAFLADSERLSWQVAGVALLPLLFTPPWGGSEIFLWAGTPYVALWLVVSNAGPHPYRWTAAAGLLVGVLFFFRYASAFLGAGGLLILLCLNWRDLQAFVLRSVVFALTASSIALGTIAYEKTVADRAPDASVYITPYDTADVAMDGTRVDARTLLDRVQAGLAATSTMVVGAPILDDFGYRVPRLRVAIGIASFLGVAAMPIVIGRIVARRPRRKEDALMVGVSLLPISLVLFLVLVTYNTTAEFNHIGTVRYYQPLMLCGVLTWSTVLAARHISVVFRLAGATLAGFAVAHYFIYMPLWAVYRRDAGQLTRLMLGFSPGRSANYSSTSVALDFPANQVYSLKENSRRKVRELHSQYPGAVFYVQNQPFYVYDAFQLHAGFSNIDFRQYPNNASFWKVAHTSRPLTVIWVTNFASVNDARAASRSGPRNGPIPLSGTVVFEDAFEKTTIVVTDISAGCRLWSPTGSADLDPACYQQPPHPVDER